MRIIDLLNKIAKNEEVPKEILYLGKTFKYDKDFKAYYCYKPKEGCYESFDVYIEIPKDLNNEIEIIEDTPKEDKKIEKLKDLNTDYYMKQKKYGALVNEEIVLDIQTLKNYINEIIDKLNKKV